MSRIERAIVVNVVMESGQRCKVVFDRYGMNKELFDLAYRNEWSDERTIAQATSEALSGALTTYPGDRPVNHTVTTI